MISPEYNKNTVKRRVISAATEHVISSLRHATVMSLSDFDAGI